MTPKEPLLTESSGSLRSEAVETAVVVSARASSALARMSPFEWARWLLMFISLPPQRPFPRFPGAKVASSMPLRLIPGATALGTSSRVVWKLVNGAGQLNDSVISRDAILEEPPGAERGQRGRCHEASGEVSGPPRGGLSAPLSRAARRGLDAALQPLELGHAPTRPVRSAPRAGSQRAIWRRRRPNSETGLPAMGTPPGDPGSVRAAAQEDRQRRPPEDP